MPVSKRANGEGMLRQRPNGGWECRIRYEDPETGQRRRKSFYGKTAKEARAAAKEAQDRLDAGAPVKDANRTVGDWLAQWRVTTLAVSDRKESTKSLYATLCRKHLEPAPFGAITLDKLRPSDIEALILRLRRPEEMPALAADSHAEPPHQLPGATTPDKLPKSMSSSTIRQLYTILRSALDGAVRDGLLARNPAVLVKRPGVERKEAKCLSADDVSRLLKAASTSRYYPALVLIASTGIRRGEAVALKWENIDLNARTMKISSTVSRIDGRLVTSDPKTQRSRRVVPLSPGLVTMLKAHRKAQLEERMRAANLWQDNGLVFATEFGTPVEPRNLLRIIEAAAKKTGLDGIGVHTLRHSVATAWLESGVHIKLASDLLGHSSISITGDLYGHSTVDAARAAVDGVAEQLGLTP
jgi:integrase